MKTAKITAIMLISVFLCGFTASADEPIRPEGIKIILSKTEMEISETQKIKVAVSPPNAEGYELEYSSSNPEIVTAAIGTLIANAEGTADITVKIKNTDISDTVTITVGAIDKTIYVTDIELGESRLHVERYEEQRIYYDIVPSNATDKTVTFTSLNTAVATVDKNGVVYGRKNGNAKIKIQSGDGKVTEYITVYVTADDESSENDNGTPVRRVDIFDGEDEVTKTIEIMRTQSKKFTVQIYPENSSDKRIRWKSADEDIAVVDENGAVTGISEGTVKIHATARDNGKQDTITVRVIPYIRKPDKIAIAPQENAVLETGQVLQFTPTFYPEDTTERGLKWFVYGDCAVIDQNGKLTITDSGKVTVKVYTVDFNQNAEYEFNATYSMNHFTQIGESFNVKQNRAIILTFDTPVRADNAKSNIFAATDANGEPLEIDTVVDGNRITITPVNGWNVGENDIFVKEHLTDIHGNKLGRNMKYKFTVRRVANAEN